MRPKEEKMELRKLMGGPTSITTLFDARKDYNKLAHRLRLYQSLALFLKSPPLAELQQLQKVHSNLRDLEFGIRDIGLAVDEMAEDWQSLGLSCFAEVLENLMENFRILHDHLVKEAKEELYTSRLDHLKIRKATNTCEECSEAHEAIHIKRIKTSFGLLYQEGQQQDQKDDLAIDKEDLALEEKEDFIDQLNFLLERKSSIANLTVNTRKYKELVDCLSKMDQIDKQLQRKGEKSGEGTPLDASMDEEADEGLQSKYSSIIEEVKNILNGKFREGYSHRIRSMLDKFQIVFKNDHLKRVERKAMINMCEQETQTPPTSEAAQLQLVREEVTSKELELAGIMEGRKKVEEKYLKLLESERRVSRQASASNAKNEKLLRQIEERQKIIEQLQKQLGRSKNDRIRRFDIFGLQQLQETDRNPPPLKSLDSPRGLQYKGVSRTSNEQRTAEQKNIETQTQIVSEQGLAEHKKKNFKFMKRFSIANNSNHLIRTFSDAEEKTMRIQNILDVCIEPTPQIRQESKPKGKKDKSGKKQGSMSKKGKKQWQSSTIKPNPKENPKKSLQYNKSIDTLHKQSTDEIIVERSQKSLDGSQASLNHEKRSSIFTLKEGKKRISRDSKNLSNIRLTELPKYFRFNHLKTDTSKTRDESGYLSNINLNPNLSSVPTAIIRINKYEKKNSATMDRDRVKEIVNLLKIQKEGIVRKSPFQQSNEHEDKLKGPAELADMELREDDKAEEVEAKENVVETIEDLKMLIESQYTYLKASGFINFLLSFEKKPSLVNRSLIKYRFQFTHLTENELYLFGGIEQMVRFTQNAGVWQRYMQDESDLKLYYKHINFAHKISKYFLLLKKMNQEFFEEYVAFITDPLTFALSRFGPTTASAIHALMPDAEIADRDSMASNQLNWKRIMMRLIRFHHEFHKNCKHIVEFLDKIGYYRYSI